MGLSKDQIEQVDALREERVSLYNLKSHKGWLHVEEHLRKTSAYAYERMAGTDNPTEMAKQVGAWHVSESVLLFIDVRLAQIEKLLTALERTAQG